MLDTLVNELIIEVAFEGPEGCSLAGLWDLAKKIYEKEGTSNPSHRSYNPAGSSQPQGAHPTQPSDLLGSVQHVARYLETNPAMRQRIQENRMLDLDGARRAELGGGAVVTGSGQAGPVWLGKEDADVARPSAEEWLDLLCYKQASVAEPSLGGAGRGSGGGGTRDVDSQPTFDESIKRYLWPMILVHEDIFFRLGNDMAESLPKETLGRTYRDAERAYGDSLRIRATDQRIRDALLGSHASFPLPDQAYKVLQMIAKKREQGATQVELAKLGDLDPKSNLAVFVIRRYVFHYVKRLQRTDAMWFTFSVKCPVSKFGSRTALVVHTRYSRLNVTYNEFLIHSMRGKLIAEGPSKKLLYVRMLASLEEQAADAAAVAMTSGRESTRDEDAVGVPGHLGRNPRRMRVSYNVEESKVKASLLLSSAKDKTMFFSDIVDALLLRDAQPFERKWLSYIISCMVFSGHVERFQATFIDPVTGDERIEMCARLLQPYTSNKVTDATLKKAVAAAGGSAGGMGTIQWQPDNETRKQGIIQGLPLDYQIFRLVRLSGQQGMTYVDIDKGLGNMGRIVENCLGKLRKPIGKEKPAPLVCHDEDFGKQKRKRYFVNPAYAMAEPSLLESMLPSMAEESSVPEHAMWACTTTLACSTSLAFNTGLVELVAGDACDVGTGFECEYAVLEDDEDDDLDDDDDEESESESNESEAQEGDVNPPRRESLHRSAKSAAQTATFVETATDSDSDYESEDSQPRKKGSLAKVPKGKARGAGISRRPNFVKEIQSRRSAASRDTSERPQMNTFDEASDSVDDDEERRRRSILKGKGKAIEGSNRASNEPYDYQQPELSSSIDFDIPAAPPDTNLPTANTTTMIQINVFPKAGEPTINLSGAIADISDASDISEVPSDADWDDLGASLDATSWKTFGQTTAPGAVGSSAGLQGGTHGSISVPDSSLTIGKSSITSALGNGSVSVPAALQQGDAANAEAKFVLSGAASSASSVNSGLANAMDVEDEVDDSGGVANAMDVEDEANDSGESSESSDDFCSQSCKKQYEDENAKTGSKATGKTSAKRKRDSNDDGGRDEEDMGRSQIGLEIPANRVAPQAVPIPVQSMATAIRPPPPTQSERGLIPYAAANQIAAQIAPPVPNQPPPVSDSTRAELAQQTAPPRKKTKMFLARGAERKDIIVDLVRQTPYGIVEVNVAFTKRFDEVYRQPGDTSVTSVRTIHQIVAEMEAEGTLKQKIISANRLTMDRKKNIRLLMLPHVTDETIEEYRAEVNASIRLPYMRTPYSVVQKKNINVERVDLGFSYTRDSLPNTHGGSGRVLIQGTRSARKKDTSVVPLDLNTMSGRSLALRYGYLFKGMLKIKAVYNWIYELCKQPPKLSTLGRQFPSKYNGFLVFDVTTIFTLSVDLALKICSLKSRGNDLDEFLKTPGARSMPYHEAPFVIRKHLPEIKLKEALYTCLFNLVQLHLVYPAEFEGNRARVIPMTSNDDPAKARLARYYILNRVVPLYDFRKINLPLLRNHVMDTEEAVRMYWLELEELGARQTGLTLRKKKAEGFSDLAIYVLNPSNWHIMFVFTKEECAILDTYVDKEKGITPLGDMQLLEIIAEITSLPIDRLQEYYTKVEGIARTNIAKRQERAKQIQTRKGNAKVPPRPKEHPPRPPPSLPQSLQRRIGGLPLPPPPPPPFLHKPTATAPSSLHKPTTTVQPISTALSASAASIPSGRASSSNIPPSGEVVKRRRRRASKPKPAPEPKALTHSTVTESAYVNQYETSFERVRRPWPENQDVPLLAIAVIVHSALNASSVKKLGMSWGPVSVVLGLHRDRCRRRLNVLLKNPVQAVRFEKLNAEVPDLLKRGIDSGELQPFPTTREAIVELDFQPYMAYVMQQSKSLYE
ncbi:hypothetical protein HDU96_007729 [Phlyctochytrium bullatum]|nr:hypothetical protein HDU96_007729 [Phlyctochytrium bullatum]